jgi:pyruvate formate lyase activating enzyme
MGFKVGLHTAGIYPDKLERILPLTDWIGFDVKADFADYEKITAIPRSGAPVWRSLQSVLQATTQRDLLLEVRTTYHPELLSDQQLLALAHSLQRLGITQWVIQALHGVHDGHAGLSASWRPPHDDLLHRIEDVGMTLVLR